jgi:hypothetical protein
MPRSPFDKLRANGIGIKWKHGQSFVLSLSKHGYSQKVADKGGLPWNKRLR